MLIEKTSFDVNDVVTLKLIGGDEILGKLVSMDNGYTISKPLLVMMAQQGFGLMPYILTANPDKNVTIDKSHVITITKTLEAVSKEYIKQTTGLLT